MWFLMLYLGLRPGEAAGLSWNDIDFTKTPGSIRTLEAPPRSSSSLWSVTGIDKTSTPPALGSAWSWY